MLCVAISGWSVDDPPPRVEPKDDPERREDWLVDAIPRDARQVYKVRDIIDAVVDRDSFLEIGRGYGRSAARIVECAKRAPTLSIARTMARAL